jgi:cob(I)alamin adenosyltransferase
MSITTKQGDSGSTALIGAKVTKADARIEANGSIDELVAQLGYARSLCSQQEFNCLTKQIQSELFIIGSIIATVAPQQPKRNISPAMIITLEQHIQQLEQVVNFNDWAICGELTVAAAYEIARTTCRRAERRVVQLHEMTLLYEPLILTYLNRLSDLLWLIARKLELDAKDSHNAEH